MCRTAQQTKTPIWIHHRTRNSANSRTPIGACSCGLLAGENERHVDAKSAMQRREERRLKIMGGMARRRPSALAPPTDSAGGVKGHRAIAYYTNARTSQRNARRSCAWTRNDRAGRYKIPMAPLVVHHRLRRKSLAREVRKGNLPSAVATPPPRPNPQHPGRGRLATGPSQLRQCHLPRLSARPRA